MLLFQNGRKYLGFVDLCCLWFRMLIYGLSDPEAEPNRIGLTDPEAETNRGRARARSRLFI